MVRNLVLLLLPGLVLLVSCTGGRLPAFEKVTEPDAEYAIERGDGQDFRYAVDKRDFERFCHRLSVAEDVETLVDDIYDVADSISVVTGDPWTVRELSYMLEGAFMSPESEFMNDAVSLAILRRELECKAFTPHEKLAIEWKINMVSSNAVGTPVNDMMVTADYGEDYRLRSLLDRVSLIFFYISDCGRCERMVSGLERSRVLASLSEEQKVRLISVCVSEDIGMFIDGGPFEDGLGWNNYVDSELSVEFRNVFDQRFIPSVYVVSADGIVLMKAETDVAEIETFLKRYFE